MFGIVRCPRCGRLQGIELGHKTASCRNCGTRNSLEKLSVIGPFQNQEEMRKRIWDIKSGEMEEGESSLSRELLESYAEQEKGVVSKKHKEGMILDLLSERISTFCQILESMGKYGMKEEELEEILMNLSENGIIFSPKYGVYGLVEE